METWIALTLLSSVLLALYDLTKKSSLRENAVMPVLFFATLSGSLSFIAALAATGRLEPALAVSWPDFWAIAIKTLLVAGSWTFAYFGVRALPISLSAPIRSTAPFWVLLGALVIYREIPSLLQAAGMASILVGYVLFSRTERREGIDFWRNRGVWCSIAGTLLGSASALYDKYLLQVLNVPRLSMQAWFCIGLPVFIGAFWSAVHVAKVERRPFVWRWTVPAVGILLVTSDFFYFFALSTPEVPISVLSLLRRSSVVITFTIGAFMFREREIRRKAIALATILVGVVLICLA